MKTESKSWLWCLWDVPPLVFLLLFGIFSCGFPLIDYIGGLRNEGILAFGAVLWLALLTPLAGLCLVFMLIRVLAFWPRHVRSRKTLRRLQVGLIVALVALLALPFTGILPPGYKTYTWGFHHCVQDNIDIQGIQQWLATVDPNALVTTQGAFDWRKQRDDWPEAVTRANPQRVTLAIDEDGHPMIDIAWHGGFDSIWGLRIGHEAMEIPQTHPTVKRHTPGGGTYDDYGQYRLPVGAGAYIWHNLS